MGALDFPRTTVFIIDKEAWIKSKAEAEHLGYASVSEYIFSLLKSDLTRQTSLQLLLLELEKYYELDYYTLEYVAEKASLPLRIVITLMNELQLPLPEKKTFPDCKRIHEELIKYKLLPREVQTILNLKNEFIKKEDVLEDADMLTVLFPDKEERTLEVLTKTRELLMEILEKENTQDFYNQCLPFKELRKVFDDFALQYDDEIIVDDPIYLKLKECNSQNLFGKIMEYSIIEVIERELLRIDEFRLGQIIKIPISVDEMKRQEIMLGKKKGKLQQELKMYLKNVASVNHKKTIAEYVS